ncbi:MAG: PLP-dependent aminotransferase family protein [Lachnospiraceae bacterium]
MLTYSFTDTCGDSLYQYLYKCIKKDITEGRIPTKTKLPSKRTLAKNLNISIVTVENAYGQLMAEGYIYSQPKKGYFVSDIIPTVNTQKNPMPLSHVLPDKIAEHEQKEIFADLVSGHTLQNNFPFSVWSKLMRQVITEQSSLLLTNPPSGGILSLRSAIAEHLHQFRGMSVLPEQIIIGAGTEYLYGLIIQLLGRDKIFAVEDPGYKKISLVYENSGVECKYIPLDKNGISMKHLNSSHGDIIHISPSHHYPTGIVTPISRRHELLQWSLSDDRRYIIEDDYDCEFRMSGIPIPTLQSIDTHGKVIYMNTFTKSLSSTIRISYMVLPKELLSLYYEKLGFYSCTVSTFEQLTLCKFMTEGYFEKHINRMRNFYKNQRNLILAAIKESPLSRVCRITEQDAGLHFLLTADTDLPDEVLAKKADKLNLRIGFLSQYYHNQKAAKEHILVINYSGIEPDKIKDAVDLLAKCILQ